MNIITPCVEFLKKNSTIIFGMSLTIIGGIICKKFDIPIGCYQSNYINPSTNNSSFSDMIFYPKNPIEASMYSIAKSTKSMSWSSDKINAAKKICQMVIQNNVSDETKSLAITMLSNIGEELNWASDKETINKLIMNISSSH